MSRRSRWIAGIVVLVILVGAGGRVGYGKLLRRDIPVYASDIDQFKYGSIGNDEANGLPYLIWRVLPTVFADHLPGPGGYASVGFLWEPGRDHSDAPIGFSRARVGFERMAINCAFCHVTEARLDANEPPKFYIGGASNTVNVLAYQQFLTACARDPRFNADVLLPAIEREVPLSFIDRRLVPVRDYPGDTQSPAAAGGSIRLGRQATDVGARPDRSVQSGKVRHAQASG